MANSPMSRVIQHLHRVALMPPGAALSDGQLLEYYVCHRHEAAFEALVRRHGPIVLGVCRRVLNNPHDADDAFQATFLVLVRKAATVKPREKLANWLYGVAHTIALRTRVAAIKRRVRERQVAHMPEPKTAQDPWYDLRELLDQEMSRLPEKYRLPIILCDLEGRSIKQATEQLGWPQGTLAGRLARARALLAKRLTRHGLAVSGGTLAAALSQNVTSAAVPAALVGATLKAASAFTTGHAAASGAISIHVAALAEGMLQSVVVIKIKLVVVLLLGFGVAAAGVSLTARQTQTAAKDEQVHAAVDVSPPKGIQETKARVDQHGDPLPDGAVARLGALRFRHSWSTTGLAFTTDAKTLIGYGASEVFFWDAATGKVRRRLPVNGSESGGVAISPDGTILAKCDGGYGIATRKDKEVEVSLWELDTGRKISTLSIPKYEGEDYVHMHHLRFTPDGKSIAWSNWSRGKAAVFDVATGQVRVFFGGADCRVSNLAVSPDSKTLATDVEGLKHRAVELWDIVTGKLIRSIHELPPRTPMDVLTDARVPAITFAPDGKKLAFALLRNQASAGVAGYQVGGGDYGFSTGHDRGDRVLVFDPATGKQLVQIEAKKITQVTGLAFTPQITDLAFTPDGNKLVFSTFNGTAGVWDLANQENLHTFQGHMPVDGRIALSPDGKTLALATYDSAVRLWDLGTGNELFTDYPGHHSHVSSLAYSPDGKTLVSAGGGKISYYDNGGKTPASSVDYGQILVWDMATKRERGNLPGMARTLSFSSDGNQLAILADNCSTIQMWNTGAGNEARRISVPDTRTFVSAVFSPDGRKLFTLDSSNRNNPDTVTDKHCIRHWGVATGKQERVWTIPKPARPHEVALAPDGSTVIGLQDGELTVYELRFGRQRLLRAPTKYAEEPLSFSPDVRLMAFGFAERRAPNEGYYAMPATENAIVRFCEIATGREIFHLKGHQGSGPEIAWSPDGRVVATWGLADIPLDWDTPASVRVWDTANGKELARFGDVKAHVTALAFSQDGTSVAAGMHDGTVLIFDVAKANPRRVPAPKLGKDELESRWIDLAGDNAGKAHQALWSLVDAPKNSVPFLRDRVKPVASADAADIQRWITDLDSGKFADRQTAAKELGKFGGQAEAPIRKALKGNITLETRRRLEQILNALSDVPGPDIVRTIRAIMALERIGSPEAKSILEDLARGAPGARETEAAQASLQWVNQRSGK